MATWRRCEKSPFYRRSGLVRRLEKRAEALDAAYVDPVDLIVVHTIPGDDSVTVLKWRVTRIDQEVFDELQSRQQAKTLSLWFERVMKEMDGGISRNQKEALFGDLDVDLLERDLLLDAVERFVFMSPESASSQQKVPRNAEAVKGLLFHWGIGPC